MKRVIIRIVIALVVVFGSAFLLLAVSAAQVGLSMPAQLIRVMLRIVPMPGTSDPEALRELVAASRARGPALPPDAFSGLFEVLEEEIDGQRVWTAALRQSAGNPLRVLYIPGGAYINETLSLHWDIVQQLIERTGATVTMPVYPLAPEHDWQPAYVMIRAIYDRLVEEVGAENIVIAGDSAGGGITLSFAQQLRDTERPLPAALVMFSPWLDVTLSDPDQVQLDERDPILSRDSLRVSGEWWAGDLPTTDPRISPLFGSLEGLPPMGVFTGTEDLLYPDATRLAARAAEAGTPLTLFEYDYMFHVWMGVAPTMIPEASRALDEAAGFIREHTGGG